MKENVGLYLDEKSAGILSITSIKWIYLSIFRSTKQPSEKRRFFFQFQFLFLSIDFGNYMSKRYHKTLQFNEYLSPSLIFHKHTSSCCPYCKFLFSPSTLRTRPKATTCNLCTCLQCGYRALPQYLLHQGHRLRKPTFQ